MSRRFLQISFTSSTKSVEKTLLVEDALALLTQHVPASELEEAVSFLEMDRMGEGYYQGRNWSISFRAI